MRIGLDVSQTGRGKAGCGYFADSLARALVSLDPGDTTYVLYPTFGPGYWDPDWPTSTLNLTDRPNVVRGLGHTTFAQLEAFWADPPADLEARLGAPDIVHSNNFFCPRGLQRARLVYTLHDVAFAEHPEWTTEANWRTCFEGVFHASVYADHIVAVSEYTRQGFLELFPHYSPERLSVVYEASRFDGQASRPRPVGLEHLQARQFWLAVGTLEPRKNYQRLLGAFARLVARGETSYPLVLVGGSGWMLDDLSRCIEDLGLTGRVQRLGYVDDACLGWLYEQCAAFCYPSLLEGFGLPVVEAMSLGAAVLTSNATSLPEVAGDAALLVDPLDVDAIYAGLRRLATHDGLVSELRVRARARAAHFSWQAAAARTLDIYRTLCEPPSTTEGKTAVGAIGTH